MSSDRRAAWVRAGIGAGFALLVGAVAHAATDDLHGDVDRILTSGRTGPACMVQLTDWPADVGVQCPGRWLAFRCTAKTLAGDHARRMFDSVRRALADGQRVALRVTDDVREGRFCVVTRITVPDRSDEADSDGDGVADLEDDVPLNASETVDSDDDGLGNHADPDDDNDGVDDGVDAFPFDPRETADTDGGGLGDNADADDDNDGVPDTEDAFPLDPDEWSDADGDGVGDNVKPSSSSFPLLDGVGLPGWVALVEGTFHIVSASASKAYAYGPTGERRRSSDFALDPSNTSPTGIAFGKGLFFVLDRRNGKIYAYERSGVRRAESDISLLVDTDGPAGLAFADDVLYVGLGPSVEAYAVSGQRDPQADLDLLGALGRVDSIQGMTYADSTDTLYVKVAAGRSEDTVVAFPKGGEPYVFRLSAHPRTSLALPSLEGLATDAGKLFVGVHSSGRPGAQGIWVYAEPTKDDATVEADDAESFQLAPANRSPKGVEYVDGRFYVTNYSGHVFAYRGDGALDPDAGFALDLVGTFDIGDITHANDRLFVAEEVQHRRGSSFTYTDHVRAYTLQGERDAAADFDVHERAWTLGLSFANGRFYLGHSYGPSRSGRDAVSVHSATGERIDYFNIDPPDGGFGGLSIAFGDDTLYAVRPYDDKVRAYTVGGERARSQDIELDACNRDPRGITVAGDVVHVADWGGYVFDGDCGEARVFAYSTKPAECRPAAPVPTALAAATVEIYQGPLVSIWRAGDCNATEYSPGLSGRDAAVVLRVEHSDRNPPSVSMKVAGVGVAAVTRETRSSGEGAWNTSSTYLVDGTLFRSGNTMSFETGRVVDQDSDYADGFEVPIEAASLAPLRVTFVPIRTPDALAPSLEPGSYMEAIRDFFPVGDYRATVGRVLNLKYSGTFTPRGAAQELSRRWYREADADEFYHGIFQFSRGLCGHALTSAPVAVSAAIDSYPPRFNPCPNIHAHEIGHNFGLGHADCGGAGNVDPRFPYPNAGTGPRRGWLLSGGRFIEPDSGYYDIMSYCQPNFISDYHYDKAFAHLSRLDAPPSHAGPEIAGKSAPAAEDRVLAPPASNGGAEAAGPVDVRRVPAGTVVVTGIVNANGELTGLRVDRSDKPALAAPHDSPFVLSVLDERRREIYAQPLAVHRDADGIPSVWGARFAADGTPRVLIIRDASGAVVFEEELTVEQLLLLDRERVP